MGTWGTGTWGSGVWGSSVAAVVVNKMNKIKLIISLYKLSEAAFHTQAMLIMDKLGDETATPPTTNADFPEPVPSPYPTRAALRVLHADYNKKYDLAVGGDSPAVSDRNAARKLLEAAFAAIAGWLEAVCNASASPAGMAGTTGFDIQHPRTHSSPPGELAGPQNVRMRHGTMSGALLLDCTADSHAGSYESQIGTDPNSEASFTSKLTTKGCTRMEHTGLTPGVLYYGRVRAIGPTGPGAWSDVAMLRAL